MGWTCCEPDFNMWAWLGTALVCLLPNGAWRNTSGASACLPEAEEEELLNAILPSFAGVLKGASWKTSEATGLSGGLYWDGKGMLVGAAGTEVALVSSGGSVCLFWILWFSLADCTADAAPAARGTLLLSSLCRSV